MLVTPCARCGCAVEDGAGACPNCGEERGDPGGDLVGTVVLGFYEVLAVLGQGGMSVVYRARHKLTDQIVALKVLPPELAVHSAIRARFLEEAKALGRLEHPNIIRLYHFGEEAGHFVLAMQYVEGEDFEQRILRQGRLPWREAVEVVRQVLSALEYAHDKGIVHRDIKPSNVLVRADGTALVMDFGIAKMSQGSARLTQTGQTMGTVRYMSPEQVRGQVVGAETDLYSLGVTLWEALVGDTPFDGSTHFDIMSKHLTEPPPSMLERVPDLPPALDAAVLRSMQKQPAARFATAREFREALEAVLAEGAAARPVEIPAPAPSPPLPGAAPRAAEASPAARSASPTPASAALPEAPARRGRAGLWLALGALVAVAAAVVGAVVLSGRGPKGGAGGDEPELVAGWPPPTLVEGYEAVVDQRFEAPDAVRVVANRPLDAAGLARAYVAARGRFVAYVARAQPGRAVDVRPLNLVVAPSTTMCAPALWVGPVDARCATRRFLSQPTSSTLYVRDDAELDRLNLPEGTAWYLCNTTPALAALGCAGLLTPYFDELER